MAQRKKSEKLEAKITPKFKKYLIENPKSFFKDRTCVFELKATRKDRIMINSSNPKGNMVKEHQITGLKEAKKGLYHKIADMPAFKGSKSRFAKRKPFDVAYFVTNDAYIGICFYVPRKPIFLTLIEIDEFIQMREAYKDKKSVTQEEIIPFASARIELKKEYPIQHV